MKKVLMFLKSYPWHVLVLLWVLVSTIQLPFDYDLGWHLRYGEYFFTQGHVLRDNIYSFVWPDYEWVQASWGFDLFLYQIFIHSGFLGLAIATGVVCLLIFILATYPVIQLSPISVFFLGAIFLSQGSPLYHAGMRAQTPSTIFFTLALFCGINTKYNKFLPLVFLIWANMHGGFALGLGILGLIWFTDGIFSRAWRKGEWRKLGILLVLSALTPLVNPWGISIYGEIGKHLTNTNLGGITEWASIAGYAIESKVFLVLVGIVITVAIIRRKRADIPLVIATLFISFLAYKALRFMIPFSVIVIFYLTRSLGKRPVHILLSCILILLVLLDYTVSRRYFFLPNPRRLTSFTWLDYCNELRHCSEEVSEIMRLDPPIGNGYHPFEYGGYLIWRVPEVKTFVDGRMAAWERNGQTPPVIDGDRIIMEPEPVTFRLFESRYQFQWAVVQTPTHIARYLDHLVANGLWERRYQDTFYSYYVKKK